MRRYQVYLLQEKVASHYFGQEPKLFQLFSERERGSLADRIIIEKQIEYISKPLPTLLLQQRIKQSLRESRGYSESEQIHLVQIKEPFSSAELIINQHYLTVTSQGALDAETIYFEILRKVDPCFFAVDVEQKHFGWLNPIRQAKYLTGVSWS
ncbi:hypothetical protein BTS2_0411 [Bacillus sp. TS-2]|nr:hypothetical protein BTS2_0411 [Bacillus sp. TS-2]